MDPNETLLRELSHMMPNQGISIALFHFIYPQDLPHEKQTRCDAFLNQVLTWYVASVVTLKEDQERLKQEKEEQKQRFMEEKRDEKQLSSEVIEDKERIIKTKEELITQLKETSDIAQGLKDIVNKPNSVQKWGTVTRSQAWDNLERDGLVAKRPFLKKQEHLWKNRLVKSLKDINTSVWEEESDMYPDVIEAICKGLYKGEEGIFVVDTHSKGTFHADISVASYEDSRLPYSLQYFIELKILKGKLDTSENCGQVLDYFNAVHEKQPHRLEFVAILSNFEQSLVFIANYSANKVDVSQQWAEEFADAVIFADGLSKSQYQTRFPELDGQFGSQCDVLSLSRQHFLLSVPKPKPSAKGKEPLIHSYNTRGKVESNSPSDNLWNDPSRHSLRANRFVLKIARGSNSVANEIAVLKQLRSSDCPHLPEIVWSALGDQQLGIVPVGVPIDFREPQATSRIVVHHLMDGLKFLHDLGIVHRDIRPSNLILDYSKKTVNVVIIDYENALVLENVSKGSGVDYLGGFISWPMRLLKSSTSQYIPEVEDDLFASILLVLHMLFPLHFDCFRASNIRAVGNHTPSNETLQLMTLWEDIEKSRIWEPFLKAAKARDYETLKGMADVFCLV